MSQAALVLCGGFSERMGRDKASLPFGGETLLERIVGIVSPCVDEVWLVAREGQEIPSNRNLQLQVARDPAEGLGPLAGLTAGLRAVSAERAFVVSCDLPLLQEKLVRGLLELATGLRAAIPTVDGHYVPTCAVYSTSLVPELDGLLAAGERRPRAILKLPGVNAISEDEIRAFDPELQSFRDCNTPERYREALELAGYPTAG
jgi:molybdopterin-guanine dinucleotide biosynthesis protein A